MDENTIRRHGDSLYNAWLERRVISPLLEQAPDMTLQDAYAIQLHMVNRRVVEAMIRAGAFDAIDARRATLFASVGIALGEAERAEASLAQVSLFGEEQHAAGRNLNVVREWTEAERLTHEKTALGFYVSGHPYAAYAKELAQIVRQPLAALQPKKEPTLVAGIVTSLRVQASRRGKMAFVTLDDGAGSVEIMVYSEVFDAARALLREDQVIVAEVKVQERRSEDGQVQGLRVIAENVYGLAAVRRRYAKALRIACNGTAQAGRLFELLSPFRNGSCPIVIEYRNRGVGGDIELPEDWRVTLDDPLLAGLCEWLPPENVRVVY